MSELRKPFLYAACDRYASLVVTLALTAAIARLLTPEELGLFALASGILLVSEALRDFGAGTYIVQERAPSRNGVRAAFTVALGIALVMALALCLAAGPIAAFYGEPRLVSGLRLAALVMVVNAFFGPPMAVLRRDLDFGLIAFINASGTLVVALTTITFVLLGLGYASLLLGTIAGSLNGILVAQLRRPMLWIYRPSFHRAREIAAFGGWVSATSFLNNLYVMLPNFVLPRIAGFEAIALFSRATQLAQLSERVIVGAVAPVILPAFSALARDGADLRRGYLNGARLVTSVQWPALLGLAILAEPVTRIVLGNQWDAAAPLLRILALASLSVAPAALTVPILVAAGHARDTLAASIVSLSIGTLIFALAAPLGLHALALSFLVSLPIQMAVALAMIRHRLGFTYAEFARACAPSAVSAIFSAAPALLVAASADFSFNMSWARILLAIAAGIVGWLAGLAATRHPMMIELRATLSSLRRVPLAT